MLASDLITADYTITKAQIGMNPSLTLKTLVTGVEITAHSYIPNSEVIELYNSTLAAGLHTITFDAPMHDLAVTGATISGSAAMTRNRLGLHTKRASRWLWKI